MTIEVFQDKTPTLGQNCYIAEQSCIIGDVIIGDHSSVWPYTVIRGDVHSIQIGHHTNIQDGSVLHVTHDGEYSPGGFPLKIGSYVTVGHQALLHACTIGDYCLVGMKSLIMDGVQVDDYCLIGAGSLVPPGKHLTSGLWVGNPAQKKRELTEKERVFLKYSAEHYCRLKDKYLKKS